MPDPLKTGFTSDQRIEQKFSFLMTDKASVKSFAQAERACTLKTAYTKNNPKNVKRLEIGKKRHPRSYLLRITNQNNNYSLHCKHDEMKLRENRQF